MKKVNSKSLLAFCFTQMEKLDNGQINVETAREQSNLVKQANNLLKYELDRTKVLMDLTIHNETYDKNLQLRNIEAED
jgi:hypothetical protein